MPRVPTVPLWLLLASLALAPAAAAQGLVERALKTEYRQSQDGSRPMRYRLRKSTPRLTTTKEIFETRDGAVARLVQLSDHPLEATDEAREQARLDALLADPTRQRHRKQSEDSDSALVFKLLRMLPTAFVYQDTGPAAANPGRLERFTFRPNPGFSAPDLESQALTNLNGEVWVDRAAERVTHLEGHLQEDTNYGWGLLGKLDKGGWVEIDQADVGGGDWRITHLQLRMSLRVLFKDKAIDTTEEMSGYRAVAPCGYQEAIRQLRAGQ